MRGSSPTVGSSRNRTRGSETSARAISSRRRWPPLRLPTGRSSSSASPSDRATDLIRFAACAGATPHRRACRSRWRCPLSNRSTTGSWNTTLLRRRAARGSRATSTPATLARPAVGAIVVVSMPTVVDFPAPFGPSSPNTSPGRTSKSMPFTASIPPGYVFFSPRTLIAESLGSSIGSSWSHRGWLMRHPYDAPRREDLTVNETDELAEQFERNRPHLRSVAYRMLGAMSDADDAVQEAWLRLSRSDSGAVANLGGWLTTVVGRVCLDMLRGRRSRREDPAGDRLPEPVVRLGDGTGDPEHEALLADSVSMALLVVLETLDPPERLAFVLHDMFGVPFEEIAPIVDRRPAAAPP